MSPLLKRVLRHVANHIFTIGVVLLFCLIMLQPHKFEADYQASPSDYVLAAYEDLLNSPGQDDGSIAFEALIVGEDGNAKITYMVQGGDTLSDIAKNFGTTSTAIIEANAIENNVIRPGQRLTITYNEGIIYEIKEEITVTQFASKYNLNSADLLTLNYLDDPNSILYPGTQLFVDLNKIEAYERGLIEKKEYEMLNIAPPQPVEPETLVEPKTEQVADPVAPDELVGDQEVISAEETQQRLEELANQQDTQADNSGICADNQCELNGKCFTKPANAVCAPESDEDAWKCADGYEENNKKCIESEPPSLCPDGQCDLNGRCFSKPENAVCAPESDEDAWKCQEGFVEEGKQCVPVPIPEVEAQAAIEPQPAPVAEEPTPQPVAQVNEPEPDAVQRTSTTPKDKNETILSQWYFNPRKAGFPGYGRGAGHCTEYAAYYWWKHYNINLREYIRGNAGQWYTNAQNAGLSVGQLPVKGAIVVMKYGSSGRSSYGHVGIVTQVDLDNRMIRIQDANFMGRFVVTDHWVDMDSEKNPIIGYIYPTS